MGYEDFLTQFERICADLQRQGRAKSFAFIFYNMGNSAIRTALRDHHGYRVLHELTGDEIALFYLHDGAFDAHWNQFNQKFMETLGIEEQATLPCLVFFRVHCGTIEDVSIYQIDDKSADPVLIISELEQYVNEAMRWMKAEGDASALIPAAKIIAPLGTLIKVGELLSKLRFAI